MATKLPIHCQIIIALALYLSDIRELFEVGEQELERKLKELRAIGKGVNEIPDRVL
jgi:hypothetical protein